MSRTVEHIKYIVEIKKVERITTVDPGQVCVEETPTEIMEENYGNRKTAALQKKYDTRDVAKVETADRSIYRQEVEKLSLVDVVNAVNAETAACV